MIFAHLIAAAAASVAPLDVYGVWESHDGTSKIEITDCGNGTPCGYIRWVEYEVPDVYTDGVLRDGYNKDKALQTRPIIGLQLLGDFESARSQWRRGEIYDPETGNTYRASLKRADGDTLEIQGCVAVMCQTIEWTASTLSEKERQEAQRMTPTR